MLTQGRISDHCGLLRPYVESEGRISDRCGLVSAMRHDSLITKLMTSNSPNAELISA